MLCNALLDTPVLTTTGEHEYTRYGFRKLIADRAVDVLQPDITWLGGLTEARRIVAMAAAYDLPVVPHGSSVYSYHLQYAFANCPIAEFINLSPNATSWHGWSSLDPSPVVVLVPSRGRIKEKLGRLPTRARW